MIQRRTRRRRIDIDALKSKFKETCCFKEAPIYHMDHKKVDEIENKFYNKDVEFFLTDGTKEEKEKE